MARARISELEAEVARLKRELADRGRRELPDAAPGASVVRITGQSCIHDAVYGVCRKLGCQPARGKSA